MMLFRRVMLAAALLLLPAAAQAQDAKPAEASMFKVALDNERIRVLNATFKPGQKASPQQRPNHMMYMLTDGTLVFSPAGRTPYEVTFKAGEAMWFPSLAHGIENAGDSEVRFMITEVKEAAARPARATGKQKRKRRR